MRDYTVQDLLRSVGKYYDQKLLNSSPKNWANIAELARSDIYDQILIRLNDYDLYSAALPMYAQARRDLLAAIRTKRHLIVAYTEVADGTFIDASREQDREHPDRATHHRWAVQSGFVGAANDFYDAVTAVWDEIVRGGFNIVPIRNRGDFTSTVQSFLQDSDRGLLLKLYLPNERLWHKELDRVLALFRDYLVKVAAQAVTLDQQRTEHGTIYSFYSKSGDVAGTGFAQHFSAFSQFLEICATDPARAEELLATSKIQGEELGTLVSRYAREARRLQIDIEYERQRKLLAIQHQMHSELSDVLPAPQLNALTRAITDQSLAQGMAPLLTLPTALTGQQSQQTAQVVNINPQYIAQVHGIVSQQLSGDIRYNEMDDRLIALINEKSVDDAERSSLRSAVDELKDESAPKPGRLTAWQKLKMFVKRIGPSVGKVTLSLLEKYLEAKLGV